MTFDELRALAALVSHGVQVRLLQHGPIRVSGLVTHVTLFPIGDMPRTIHLSDGGVVLNGDAVPVSCVQVTDYNLVVKSLAFFKDNT